MKLSWKAETGSCKASPTMLGLGFCPLGAGEPQSNGMAASYVCLRGVTQVSGQWKYWNADGRIKTKEGATAIVQARNDGAEEKGS